VSAPQKSKTDFSQAEHARNDKKYKERTYTENPGQECRATRIRCPAEVGQ